MCPNCNKYSSCGCKSCHKRKGMANYRTKKHLPESAKCPYCRKTFSYDMWEISAYSPELLVNFKID